jgi:hypothetical protein
MFPRLNDFRMSAGDSMQKRRVTSLSDFINAVDMLRERWRVPADQELWFRGECQKHDTILRPKLYRPPTNRSMKRIPNLLNIENDLYGEFQRCAIQYLDTPPTDDSWDWDLYLLMQHHDGPTRLLDWSDGALVALHFALRDRTTDSKATSDPVVYVLNWKRLQTTLNREVGADKIKGN